MTDFAKQYGVEIRIARIFNTYGPRMAVNDGRVVSTFIVNALAGRPLILNGGGEITRSFMYVGDLVRGLIKLMQSNYNRPVNLGNPDELTIKGLAKIVLDLTGSVSTIKLNGGIEDDPQRRKPDISLAGSMLSWQPKIDLIDGLQKTIGYFRCQN
jgi:UDP-glucuronate decarboxylase